MIQALSLPWRLLRGKPALVTGFALASIGRAALNASTILLIHEFLAAVLGSGNGWATRLGFELPLWGLVALLLGVQLAAVLLTYQSRLAEQRILAVVELGTMDRLIRHVLTLSVGFFDRRTQGDLVQTIRQDVANLRSVTMAAAALLLEAMQAAGLIAVAVSLSPRLAVWAFVLVPLAAVPITIVARRTLARSFGVRRKSIVVFDMLLQLLHGIRIIRIYGADSSEADRTVHRARQYFDELLQMERTRALARVALDTMASINTVVVVIAGGLQVRSGVLGWAELLAFLLAARAVQGPLNNMNTAYLEIQRHGASSASIDALLRRVSETRDRPDARPMLTPPRLLSVHDVGFTVNGSTVLENVSFEVAAGETLGIVGPSGAGKTTLLNLIARFYDPTSGAISCDGVDLRDLRLADVHRGMAIVTQDPFLFAASVADNIRRGRPGASDDEIESAARAAEIHDDIVAMPEQYQTAIGHGGRALSRGEAQRVNIARAILKNAPILLLDEATSSLDSYSEARVQRALDRLMAGRLVLSVTHRLSTLRNVSRILVMENGRVVGLGKHAELLHTCPTYQRLSDAQTHGGALERVSADTGEVRG
ncbi:MAG TPA: ABC transporter ATP-binding protein [Thermoanaerobaculia bacterium]|nr:ABC transporter ATP-binding protein [Thermoanaerobaculia bacterium]